MGSSRTAETRGNRQGEFERSAVTAGLRFDRHEKWDAGKLGPKDYLSRRNPGASKGTVQLYFNAMQRQRMNNAQSRLRLDKRGQDAASIAQKSKVSPFSLPGTLKSIDSCVNKNTS
jgi:hypothetical protein